MQPANHRADALVGLERKHQVQEVVALEADRTVAVGARAAQPRIVTGEFIERVTQVGDRLHVAARRDEYRRHFRDPLAA